MDVETAPYCLDCQREHDINHTKEVIIGSEQGTTFPTMLWSTTVCNVLIDTGSTRCCMSETYYKKFQLPKIQLLQNVSGRSATVSNLAQNHIAVRYSDNGRCILDH